MLKDIVISIIIPVYNREELLVETLDSIIEQTFRKWECILVDDGSQDKSLEVLQLYAAKDNRIKVFSRPKGTKKGAPSCRNFGFLKATGKYIQFFDSDDIMLPNMLKEKGQFMQLNEQYDFVVSKMAEFIIEDNWITPDYEVKSNETIIDFLKYKIYFLTPGPLFKKSFLAQNNKLFDDNLKKNQEWEFYSRLLLSGCQYGVLDKVHCLRRIHDSSIKSTFISSNEVDVKYLKIMALNRLNLNTKKKHRILLIKLFWKDYLMSFFLFLKFKRMNYLSYLIKSCLSFVY